MSSTFILVFIVYGVFVRGGAGFTVTCHFCFLLFYLLLLLLLFVFSGRYCREINAKLGIVLLI